MYSVHEPKFACIAKGKAGKKYEFGNKVSLAATSKGGWLLGALSLLGNPYDGHTLDAQLAQVRRLVTTHAVKGVSNFTSLRLASLPRVKLRWSS